MLKRILLFLLLAPAFFLSAQEAAEEAFAKSYTLEKVGNYTGAINAIKAVYTASDYEANLRLGYLCYQAALHAEAMNYYARAILLKPGAVEPRMGYVYPASMLGKWDEVAKQYQEVLRIDPRNTNVSYKLGLIMYNRKNYGGAIKHFNTVVTLYPFDYDGLLMYAWSSLQLGKMKEARIHFHKVLLLSPRDKSALEGLALIK